MDYDIIALGDLITNFAYKGTNADGIAEYQRFPAGTTSNMLAQAAKLGAHVALLSAIGNDIDGAYLYQFARDAGIDVSNLVMRDDLFTRSVFVYFKENHDRYFSYNGTKRTHFELKSEEINVNIIRKARIFDFPLNALGTNRPIFDTLSQLLKIARESSTLLAVDANYRGQYIPPDELHAIREGIRMAHIVKMTRDEMAYYLEEDDLFRGTEKLLCSNAKVVAVTMDQYGCFLRSHAGWVYQPTYQVDVQDTTGAGDSFMGSLLYRLTRQTEDPAALSQEQLSDIADFCNACASLSTTRRGSMSVMSAPEEVAQLRQSGKLSQMRCAVAF